MALLMAAQAVPETTAEPELPQCDYKFPDEQSSCIELEQSLYWPAMVLRMPELADLRGDSIRVTMIPSGTGQAELYQATFDPHGRASLLAIRLVGHGYRGWRETGREEFVLTTREYRGLADQVDAALERAEPDSNEICLHMPGMLTERYRGGRTTTHEAWGCAGQRSQEAFALVAAFACRQIGRETASFREICATRLRFARGRD